MWARAIPYFIEHADRILGEIIERVGSIARRILRRVPRVAVVISNYIPAMASQSPAEFVGPPQHRGHSAHDQEQRRMRRISEGFRGDLCSIRPDQSLGHDVARAESAN
jgi:hypothetical protein